MSELKQLYFAQPPHLKFIRIGYPTMKAGDVVSDGAHEYRVLTAYPWDAHPDCHVIEMEEARPI